MKGGGAGALGWGWGGLTKGVAPVIMCRCSMCGICAVVAAAAQVVGMGWVFVLMFVENTLP